MRLSCAKPLTESAMEETMAFIMSGRATDEEIAAFLTDLAARGETTNEIVGAARVLREKALSIRAPADAIDCCGTGGDGSHTYNISTAVAIVAASCGVPVAKHGNRAASSKSGAADVLEALGVNLDLKPAQIENALRQFNFAFMMAPRHHEAMKHVAAVRKQLGFRTIFNLLGPLANPAGAKRQLVGVFDEKWITPIAESLRRLGAKRAWVVHGADGLDEITVTGPTKVAILSDGLIGDYTLTPDDFGLPIHDGAGLKGGDAQTNAAALTAILNGEKSAYLDIVLANTAAVMSIHGTQSDLKIATAQAAEAIDSGKALDLLNAYRDFTHERP